MNSTPHGYLLVYGAGGWGWDSNPPAGGVVTRTSFFLQALTNALYDRMLPMRMNPMVQPLVHYKILPAFDQQSGEAMKKHMKGKPFPHFPLYLYCRKQETAYISLFAESERKV